MTATTSPQVQEPIPTSRFESGVYRATSARPTEAALELVERLNAVPERSTLVGMCEAGALILKIRNAEDAGKNRPGVTAPTSFRQLAALPGMTMSAASLYRAVSIYELWRRMPELLRCKKLGVGHVSAVLCLKEELQMRLLRQAQEETWTKARLQEEVDKYRFQAANVRA